MSNQGIRIEGAQLCAFVQQNTTAGKERRSSYTSWHMNRIGEHYAKWNKPGGERQIPYDLTYKWNLINKTNKQAK